jgi:hypothetical protein
MFDLAVMVPFHLVATRHDPRGWTYGDKAVATDTLAPDHALK